MEIEIMSGKPKGDKEGYDEYDIKHCANVLIEAEEIKSDAKKMKAIKNYLQDKSSKINSIQGLKDKASKLEKEEMDYEKE